MAVAGPFYSQAELEAAWVAAGGDPGAGRVAAAIAMAESSGGLNSTSPNPAGGLNYGPWQIWAMTQGDLLTLAGNARAAVSLSDNGRNWCPWQTWDGRGCQLAGYNGAYLKYMGDQQAPASNPVAGSDVPVTIHAGAPLPAAQTAGERAWDFSGKVRAAAKARAGHAHVLETAARNVTIKLRRWRLPA